MADGREQIDRNSRQASIDKFAPLQGMSREQIEQIIQRRGGGGRGSGRGGDGFKRGLNTAANLFLQMGGLKGVETKQPSPLDELVKIQTQQMKQAQEDRTVQKFEREEKEAVAKGLRDQAEFEQEQADRKTAGGVIEEVGKAPQLTDRTAGGGVVGEPQIPTDIVPLGAEPTPGVTQVDLSTLPSSSPRTANEPVEQPQLTGSVNLDSIAQELNNAPLMLKSVTRKIDNTGKETITESAQVNPLYVKVLENKLAQGAKLDDVEVSILKQGKEELAKNERNLGAVSAIMQKGVASWKAAAAEKENIPNIKIPKGIPIIGGQESALLKSKAPAVAQALDLTGYSASKAYIGQRIEMAMSLSKIITGGSRIVKSIIFELLKTIPEDNGITEDMERLVTQSINNSSARANGRELTPEEQKDLDSRILGILETPAQTVPSRETFSFIVDGTEFRDIPAEDVQEFWDTRSDDANIEVLD